MAECIKCSKEIPDGAMFCPWCGRKQIREKKSRTRGNGEGTVFKLENGKYKAIAVIGWTIDKNGKQHKKTRTKTCATKKEALAALPDLFLKEPPKRKTSFADVYEEWLPTHEATSSTINCYKSAFKYFKPVYAMDMKDITKNDLQQCLDKCGKGKRTQQNMKALAGLLYDYAIPEHIVPDNLNQAKFLKAHGEDAVHRESFSDAQIAKIKKAVGVVPMADMIYCMIYTGFRPVEFLDLKIENYDSENQTVKGGAKTKAGKNRTVTLSPKIQPIFKQRIGDRKSGYIFLNEYGNHWAYNRYTDRGWYPVLEAIGIDNPVVDAAGGTERHKYTPHTCRHTFATLMKNAPGAPSDKQRLSGHSSEEMLNYYEDLRIDDLRKITDSI